MKIKLTFLSTFLVFLLQNSGNCQLQEGAEINLDKGVAESIAYQEDGKYMITASSNLIQIWYNGSNDAITTIDPEHKEITALAVSFTGSLVATGGNDDLIKVIDFSNSNLISTLSHHTGEILSLAISPDNKYLVSTSKDGLLIIWDLLKNKILLQKQLSKAYFLDADFSDDGQLLVTGNSLGIVSVWETTNWTSVYDKKIHQDWIRSVVFLPGKKEAMSAGDDGNIIIINLTDTPSYHQPFKSINSKIYALDISPDNQYLAVGTSAREIIIYEMETKAIISKIKNGSSGTTTAVKFDPTGKYLVGIGYGKRSISVWHADNLGIIPSFRLKDDKDKTAPMIYVSNPPNLAENYLRYSEPIIDIKGLVMDESGVNLLLVNGIKTPLRDNGNFVIKVPLVMGDNYITIEAHDVNDNIALKKFIINRRDLDGTAYDAAKAKNYLLVVGINDYESWPKLYNAVSDANDVVNTLLTDYQFEFANTTLLTDKNATKDKIYNTMRGLIEKITPNDNLVIYYSGHGYFDELMNEGYWVPVDANKGSQSEYLSNSSLLKIISNINSQHTFLVADACFSGSLFNETTRGYSENVEKYRSRWGLVSGRLEVVSDGVTGENSPFAKYFLNYLKDNEKDKFTVSELVQYVKIEVANESNQTPLGNPIKSAGDEGGEFVFYKRQ